MPAPSERENSEYVPSFDWFLKQERFNGTIQNGMENMEREISQMGEKVDNLCKNNPGGCSDDEADKFEKQTKDDAKQWKTLFFRLLASVVAAIIVMFTLATFLLKNIVNSSVESRLKSQLKVEQVEQDTSGIK